MLALGGSLLACSGKPSETLREYGDYVTVPSEWIEQTDNIKGPKAFLVYRRIGSFGNGTLIVACDGGKWRTLISPGSPRSNPMSMPAKLTVKFDSGSPETMNFSEIAGRIGLEPGSGEPEEAKAFLDRLKSSSKLAVQIEMAGMDLTDQLSFDLVGIEQAAANVELACSR